MPGPELEKCEVISHDFCSIGGTLCAIPGLHMVNPEVATILGCAIAGVEDGNYL